MLLGCPTCLDELRPNYLLGALCVVTPRQLSQHGVSAVGRTATVPPMTYTVLVRIDSAGRWPVVAKEDEEPFSDAGARWRFVASVSTWAEAQRLREELHRQRERGEL
jgi:hypothetical protein